MLKCNIKRNNSIRNNIFYKPSIYTISTKAETPLKMKYYNQKAYKDGGLSDIYGALEEWMLTFDEITRPLSSMTKVLIYRQNRNIISTLSKKAHEESRCDRYLC